MAQPQRWKVRFTTGLAQALEPMERLSLPGTTAALSCLVDIPLYHTLNWEAKDFLQIAAIIREELAFLPGSRL